MEWLFAIIGLILAIPVGYILRILTSDEIKYGRVYFKAIIIISIIASIISLFLPLDVILKKSLFSGFLFIAIVSFISWWK
ncbi:hypothetical protein COU56_03080 [Candidatus Pacearchaeota archaeon CG10_big_fil_rev_8_21_14_0_10_31_9]|nr:MAG: hypothetical protein COU56_03080 [Candidatus Pacearchaeota archaeon CG10_big_fil_rev_8_21_14_0_10_31_9]PIZ83870.1 MAG: hypothetical protein COX97_00295 [Candidatus Pacearchaeota archaeon CG_4_10_14_0_2_um_filter_05_32_18]